MKKIILLLLLLVLLTGGLYFIKSTSFLQRNIYPHIPNYQHHATLSIKGHAFSLLLARTPEEQNKGLGERDSLPADTGMLFLFDHPDYYRFWMKGMRFPLDIIYIRQNKIVTIFQHVPFPSAQTNSWQIYTPLQAADSVLEINAGSANKYNFTLGDIILENL